MAAAVSTTRWRGKPILLQEYDVAILVPLARRARSRIVEFDWAFSPDDLRRLRRAAYEWGSAVVGRYKCFDARVLDAINAAIGETDSVFVLREPKNSQWIECDEELWPRTLPSFLRNYETLIPNITKLIRLITFHLAPLDGDAHLHNRVEGLIGRHFKAHGERELRDFFLPGLKLPAAMPYDRAIRLVLSSEAPIAGFSAELRE